MKLCVFFSLFFFIFNLFTPLFAHWGDTHLQVSLFHPIQACNENYSVKGLRVNLLYGKNRDLIGFDIGCVNHLSGTVWGYQSGLINIDESHFKGIQLSFVNKIGGHFMGCQIGFSNTIKHFFQGIQLGLHNDVGGDFTGFQIGLVNKVEKFFHGLQIGIHNVSEKHRGVQLGLINKTKHLDGLQVGLLNIRKSPEHFLAVPFVNWNF